MCSKLCKTRCSTDLLLCNSFELRFCKAVRNLSLGEGMNFKQVWNDINVGAARRETTAALDSYLDE